MRGWKKYIYLCVSQFNQRLKDQGLSEDVKLKMVKWPDGKFFHKKEKEKVDQSCTWGPFGQGPERKKTVKPTMDDWFLILNM